MPFLLTTFDLLHSTDQRFNIKPIRESVSKRKNHFLLAIPIWELFRNYILLSNRHNKKVLLHGRKSPWHVMARVGGSWLAWGGGGVPVILILARRRGTPVLEPDLGTSSFSLLPCPSSPRKYLGPGAIGYTPEGTWDQRSWSTTSPFQWTDRQKSKHYHPVELCSRAVTRVDHVNIIVQTRNFQRSGKCVGMSGWGKY